MREFAITSFVPADVFSRFQECFTNNFVVLTFAKWKRIRKCLSVDHVARWNFVWRIKSIFESYKADKRSPHMGLIHLAVYRKPRVIYKSLQVSFFIYFLSTPRRASAHYRTTALAFLCLLFFFLFRTLEKLLAGWIIYIQIYCHLLACNPPSAVPSKNSFPWFKVREKRRETNPARWWWFKSVSRERHFLRCLHQRARRMTHNSRWCVTHVWNESFACP